MKSTWLHRINKEEESIIVSLADREKLNSDTPIVVLPVGQIWKRESLLVKRKSIFRLKYKPTESVMSSLARDTWMEELFGTSEDFGEPLFDLMVWHFSREWDLDKLTEEDIVRVDALVAINALNRKRYWDVWSPNLNLRLAQKVPWIGSLIFGVVAKIPIISIQYFVDVNSRYAFNEIRKSGHQYSSELISSLYDILFLQQKIAVCLHAYIRSMDIARREKQKSLFIKDEVDLIINAESIISYLKASIEKMLILIGYIFGNPSIDSKKTHIAKINTLKNIIPESVKINIYYKFVEELISTKNLELLNKYRTAILHKRGIANLLPHKFYANSNSKDTFGPLFKDLHEQHSKNSIILISALALLTDELVKLDRPRFNLSDLPMESLVKWNEEYLKK